MSVPLAWLNLTYERTRLLAALTGVSFAIILAFMNLGFLGSLETTASSIYDRISADIYLISPQALELTTTRPFPRERIYQAASVQGVQRVMPLYVGYIQWRNPNPPCDPSALPTPPICDPFGQQSRAMFAFGINPADPVFRLPELSLPENQAALQRWNTVLFDRLSRPEYGPQAVGTKTQADRRAVEIGGLYAMGGGFAADGTLIMSDRNYRRYFPRSSLDRIDLGLIQLTQGSDPKAVAAKIDSILPEDVLVLTKNQIIARDRDYWINTTSTGTIFTMGVSIALLVGAVIVYQILYTDISSHTKQYATLKAMGYSRRFLFGLVLQEALILAVLGYIPGFAVSLGLYQLTRWATSGGLPIAMTVDRAIFVLFLSLGMCAASGIVSVRHVTEADPADVF